MWSYILKRLLLMIPTLLGVLTLTFAVIQFVPGGPVEQMQHELRKGARAAARRSVCARIRGVDAQQIAQLKALYGFDKPPLERYVLMLKRFATLRSRAELFPPSKRVVADRLEAAGVDQHRLVDVLSDVSDIGAARHREGGAQRLALRCRDEPRGAGRLRDSGLRAGRAAARAVRRRHVPATVSAAQSHFGQLGATESLGGKILDYLWHITLPVTASVVGSFAVVTMLTKNAFLDEIRKQYVLTARAKGLSEKRVLWKHVFRNALLPLIVGFPAAFIGAFFTGSLLIETLFSLDGLGPAVVRIGGAARLSGRARHAVSVHADRACDQADLRSLLRAGSIPASNSNNWSAD